jgi:hypothetical protein
MRSLAHTPHELLSHRTSPHGQELPDNEITKRKATLESVKKLLQLAFSVCLFLTPSHSLTLTPSLYKLASLPALTGMGSNDLMASLMVSDTYSLEN